MAVLGIGLDVVDVDRLGDALSHPTRGARFKRRVFTDRERDYCEARRGAEQAYAARFAAKEAVFKALSGDREFTMAWRDVEVINAESGKPSVALHGRIAERAKLLGAARIHVSLSHDARLAAAQVVLESA